LLFRLHFYCLPVSFSSYSCSVSPPSFSCYPGSPFSPF
jgi:hypothetical protein